MLLDKNVLIKISSTIDNITDTGLPDGEREVSDSEVSDSEARGVLRENCGSYVISYSELSEGGEISSEIELSGNSVRVMRRGAIVSDMRFCEGEADASVYSIPPYSFDARIFTRRIRGKINENGGSIDIFYDMELGGAKKSVKMKLVCEADDGN